MRSSPSCGNISTRCRASVRRWTSGSRSASRSAAPTSTAGTSRTGCGNPRRRGSPPAASPRPALAWWDGGARRRSTSAYAEAMELPPGPRAPAAWQTMAWMARPAAFLRSVHERFGGPATIRTYWTEEPMVLFSSPDAVREIFRLSPAVAPAGQSWEFLRPFAGPDSILLLDGDPHLRERRLMQGPFHGDRMRAFAPMVAELARQELGAWRGRVVTLDRMRQLTLEIILRVIF